MVVYVVLVGVYGGVFEFVVIFCKDELVIYVVINYWGGFRWVVNLWLVMK